MYAANVLRACTVVAVVHVMLGLGLARFFRGEQFKGFPLYTYWHSMLHTGIVFPVFLFYFASTATNGWDEWLQGDGSPPSDDLGAAQWVQATAPSLQPSRSLDVSPGGLEKQIQPVPCPPTFHNIMSLHGGTSSRLLRVAMDVLTRSSGLFLITTEFHISRARGLPLYLQVWSWLGGLAWFGINATWTLQVATGLWRRRRKAS